MKTWKVVKFEILDTGPGKSWNFCNCPWKSWNLDIQIYISNRKHTGIQSLHFFRNMGVSLRVKGLWIHWKGPWNWHWKVLESEMSKCVWTLHYCVDLPIIRRGLLTTARDLAILHSFQNQCHTRGKSGLGRRQYGAPSISANICVKMIVVIAFVFTFWHN